MQKLRLGFLFASILVASLFSLHAEDSQGAHTQEKEAIVRATVISVGSSSLQMVPNTETEATYKAVTVLFKEGDIKGEQRVIEDSTFPLKEGDTVYVRHLTTGDGAEYFSIFDIYRFPSLLFLFLLFVVAVLLIGGKQGFLSLIALFLSFGGIFNFLFPSILNGGNIVFIATLGALLSLFVVMFLTHGVSRLTVSAYLGCVLSVIITLLLALYSVKITALSGFASEESVFLNLATKGGLDFVALLIGGILIGVIGVIDDIAITQASVVQELRSVGEHLSQKELYVRAMKVGKDHMGAVINTLILAYTGASLPIVLLLYVSDSPAMQLLNSEVITTEVVRMIVSSVGLLSAVPLTTLIAVLLVKKSESSHTKHVHHHH